MLYTSVYFKNNEKIDYRSNISEDEYLKANKALIAIRLFMNEIDYCLILRENIYDFLSYIDSQNMFDSDSFIQLNRKVMNLLNAFYTWIEYHEKNYNSVFSQLKGSYYDTYFEYRLAYELRKYATHHSACITSIQMDILSGKNSINISMEELLKAEKNIKANVRAELLTKSQKSKHIDSYEFFKSFLAFFENFQGKIWKELQSSISNEIDFLLNLVQPEKTNIYESYIISTESKNTVSVGSMIHLFMQKILNIPVPQKLLLYLSKNEKT